MVATGWQSLPMIFRGGLTPSLSWDEKGENNDPKQQASLLKT